MSELSTDYGIAGGRPTWEDFYRLVRTGGLHCPAPICVEHPQCVRIEDMWAEIGPREPVISTGTLHIQNVDQDWLEDVRAMVERKADIRRFSISVSSVVWVAKPRPTWWHPVLRIKWDLADPTSKRRGDFEKRETYLSDVNIVQDGAGYEIKPT